MKIIKIIILSIFFAATLSTSAQDLFINVYENQAIKELIIEPTEKSKYNIIGIKRRSEEKIYKLKAGRVLFLRQDGRFVTVQSLDKELGKFDEIQIIGKDKKCLFFDRENSFQVAPVVPDVEQRIYDNNITIKSDGHKLVLVNKTDIDKYVVGVLSSINDPSVTDEYLKAKSILARSFALKNLNRHKHNRFNLCDNDHCLPYNGRKGKSVNSKVEKAVIETVNMVALDTLNQILDPTQIVNLQKWTRPAIDLNDWKKSLAQYKIPQNLSINYFTHNYTPGQYQYKVEKVSIPLVRIKAKHGLPSTMFNISTQGTFSLKINGYGYGDSPFMTYDNVVWMEENSKISGSDAKSMIMSYYVGSKIVPLSTVRGFDVFVKEIK